MLKSSTENSRLIKIIKKKNLCLSENPKGIDINWPKSFAKLYYSQKVEEIFHKNKSPRILEINNKNYLREKMWIYYFDDPEVIFESFNNVNDLLSNKELNKDNKFEMIIISNYKDIDNIFLFINLLKKKLTFEGVIIIENVYFSLAIVSRIFFSFETNIFDFRLNKFIINNCLLEIKNSNKINFFSKNKLNINSYFYHLFIDLFYISIYKLNLYLNKIKL